jgi:hypothetical protein
MQLSQRTPMACRHDPPRRKFPCCERSPTRLSSAPLREAALAQPVEHRIRNAGVACSSHAGGTTLAHERGRVVAQIRQQPRRFTGIAVTTPVPGCAGFARAMGWDPPREPRALSFARSSAVGCFARWIRSPLNSSKSSVFEPITPPMIQYFQSLSSPESMVRKCGASGAPMLDRKRPTILAMGQFMSCRHFSNAGKSGATAG